MRLWNFSVNGGMVAAGVLLATGGTMMVTAGENRALHTGGLGVVILAGAVYFVARIAMLMRNRRP